ncbi:MAG: DNA repair protein RecN [Spirochaetes bacterium]|nr:DNA repair protein RecN [Spirochaetota bacterium]MBU0956349.1 DNA repair protein RecN [Spirochaetota bacterium]
MLEELTIRDFAIIDRLQVRFEAGLNLLTGETGAGKSILIGALGFLLGSKAETGMIRSGAEETLVSGIFDVSNNSSARQWLEEHGMSAEEGTVILRRSLKNTGRGAVYIQNTPVLRQDLAEFTATLVEIHGQRDGIALLKNERQRLLLDRYAGLQAELDAYGLVYNELCAKRRSLERLVSGGQAGEREMELLQFAVDEISAAKLQNGEEERLQEEERRLSQFEKLGSALAASLELLSGEDAILSQLRKLRTQVETAAAVDTALGEYARVADSAYFDLEDCSSALSAYADRQSFDPARLEEIESRLALLQKLKRKYGGSIDAVLAYRDESLQRLSSFQNRDEEIAALQKSVAALEKEVHRQAEAISAGRRKAAAELEPQVQRILADLGMPHARFKADLPRKPLENGNVVVGPYGVDEVQFLISANRGEPLRLLSAVASGGELSRIMLAIKTVFIVNDDIPSMIFDEIDTGIGGEVALSLGLHLAEIAKNRQILCITHLASMAVRADNHYKVEKQIEGERTVTRLVRLDEATRVREIARMLSGDSSAETSLNHARDLLAKYSGRRGS